MSEQSRQRRKAEHEDLLTVSWPRIIVTFGPSFVTTFLKLPGIPLHGLQRYVRPQGVWVLSRFGQN